MRFSCFKKPVVDEDIAPVSAAPATSNGLGTITPLPKAEKQLITPEKPLDSKKRHSRDGVPSEAEAPPPVSLPLPEALGEDDRPWHAVDDPLRWTGPPVPASGPGEEEEPFMTAEANKVFKGCPLLPWEGETWTAPQLMQIIHAGLQDLRLDPKKGKPDTHKLSAAQQMSHMRRACADILPTPLFAFLLRVFEGPDTDPGVACDRFLTRILKGCKDAVYCSIAHPIPHAYEEISDSRATGASLYLRIFLVRFAKRFPPQRGFVNPHVDDDAVRRKLIDDVGDGFQSWNFMEATVDYPAAVVLRVDNKGLKAMCAVPKPTSWMAVNHFYEFCIMEPSRELSGHPSIFIIDLGKVTMSQYNKTNISAAAAQMQAALFHPEPFSAFVVAHAPGLFQFAWSIAKFFISESARDKFIILNGSASSHFHKTLGVPLEKLPTALGGKSAKQSLLTAQELLLRKTQQRAVDAHFRAERGAAGARPDGRSGTRRAVDSAAGQPSRDVVEAPPRSNPEHLSAGQGAGSRAGTAGGEGDGGRGGGAQFARSDTMGAVVTLQGKVEELQSKLDQALTPPRKGGGDDGDGGGGGGGDDAMKTMMMAQTGLMLLLVLVLAALIYVLVYAGGGARNIDGL